MNNNNTLDVEDVDNVSENKRRRIDTKDSNKDNITSVNLPRQKDVVELTLRDNTKFFLPKLPS